MSQQNTYNYKAATLTIYEYKVNEIANKNFYIHDVKIELILKPYDVSTANGEMIFGMSLVFGQRERKKLEQELKGLWKISTCIYANIIMEVLNYESKI